MESFFFRMNVVLFLAFPLDRTQFCSRQGTDQFSHSLPKRCIPVILYHYKHSSRNFFPSFPSFTWGTPSKNCSILWTDHVRGLMSKHIFAPNCAYCLYILAYCLYILEAIVYIGQRHTKVLNRGSAILDSTILEVSKFFVQISLRTRRELVIVVKNASILDSPFNAALMS